MERSCNLQALSQLYVAQQARFVAVLATNLSEVDERGQSGLEAAPRFSLPQPRVRPCLPASDNRPVSVGERSRLD
jgi:hypothetical protein